MPSLYVPTLVCDCGTVDQRHDYSCRGWRRPNRDDGFYQGGHTPHMHEPRLDAPDPWGWAARGITNPDKETQ
ncbi:hypothetical protein [Prescottella equi]|uniref:hypothetical protein n=1 Tax=Rhodococcus hoagii TaxID=43767 RepID=UPI001EEAD98C|nr:hypothetical protein [Prescottella equi]